MARIGCSVIGRRAIGASPLGKRLRMEMKNEGKSRLTCPIKRRIGKYRTNCCKIRIAGRLRHNGPHLHTSTHPTAFTSGLKMSTAVHCLIEDLHKFQNLDSGIEGDFPLDAAVTESQASIPLNPTCACLSQSESSTTDTFNRITT
jgi:hypothetical protein